MKFLNPSFGNPLLSMALPFPNGIISITINIPAAPLPSFFVFPFFSLEYQPKSTKPLIQLFPLGLQKILWVSPGMNPSVFLVSQYLWNVLMSEWSPWKNKMGSEERKIGIPTPPKGGGRSLGANFRNIPIKSNIHPLNPAPLASNINPIKKIHLESSVRSLSWNSVASWKETPGFSRNFSWIAGKVISKTGFL